MGRYRTPHFTQNRVQQFGFFEQDSATAGVVDRLGRATEIQVDHPAAQLRSQSRIVSQARRIGTQQLHPQWHARTGPGAFVQFRGKLVEVTFRQ